MCKTSLILICAFVGYAHAEEQTAHRESDLQGFTDRLMNRALTANLHADLENTVAAKPPRGGAAPGGAAPAGPSAGAQAEPSEPASPQAAEEAALKKEEEESEAQEYATPKPQGPTLSPQQEKDGETLSAEAEEDMQGEMQEAQQKEAAELKSAAPNYQGVMSKVKEQWSGEMKNLMSSMMEESDAAMEKISAQVNSTKKTGAKEVVIKYMGKQELQQLLSDCEKRGKEDVEKIVQEVKAAGGSKVNVKEIVKNTQTKGMADLKQLVTQFKANATGELPPAKIKQMAADINATGAFSLDALVLEVAYADAPPSKGEIEQGVAQQAQEDLEEIIQEVYERGMSQLNEMLQKVDSAGKQPAEAKSMRKVAVGESLMAQSSDSSVSFSAAMMIGFVAGTGVTLFLLHLRRTGAPGKEPLLPQYK